MTVLTVQGGRGYVNANEIQNLERYTDISPSTVAALVSYKS